MSSQRLTDPELPELDEGIHHLAVESDETGPLQSLALDHILTTGGEACWVDAQGRATTTTLARLAPDPRLLDRVHVARGFTAHQHHMLLERVKDAFSNGTTLLVCPAIDSLYRDAAHDDGGRLFESALNQLTELASQHDLTVLVTVAQEDAFTERLSKLSSHLECTRTKFGPRFIGEDFETLVYPGDGYVQTTLAFWERVLVRRQTAHATTPAEVTARGAN